MTDPRTAPYAATTIAAIPTDGEPGDVRFHMVRSFFDVLSFGVNAVEADTGAQIIGVHDEATDYDQRHEELFAVISGHARFTVDGTDLDAPTGTLVFVRDPTLKRGAIATADGTTVLCLGGRPGHAFAISKLDREQATDFEH